MSWFACRLYMLEEQCNTWGGITSVAVYLPLVYFQSVNDKKLQEAISHVEDFHEQIDRTHGTLHLDVSQCGNLEILHRGLAWKTDIWETEASSAGPVPCHGHSPQNGRTRSTHCVDQTAMRGTKLKYSDRSQRAMCMGLLWCVYQRQT